MKLLTKNLANIFTLTNLFLGFTGIINTLYGDPVAGALLLILAAVFDFLDGATARILKSQSKLGKQLDSLADIVSFGILPATILHVLLIKSHQDWIYRMHFTGLPLVSLLAFIFVIAAALRLAKFNLDDNQLHVFKGLPTPAAALFVAALPLIMRFDLYVLSYESFYLESIILNPWVLLLITFGLSFLMLSNIPLLAIKFSDWSWENNMPKYLLLLISIPLFIFLLFLAIPIIIMLYIAFSFIFKTKIQ
ncbi:MAG: CDP-alcohol phosphatidyltransferase family protein [Bacteroidetes bacterium]|nr:CDP-alcohol phosphatidyltransferase family protein [Bacteroidota bacterium]MBL6962767.1 CDP-alcohol phosphatidyltransferase family protein [Bacteroidota bacterium]